MKYAYHVTQGFEHVLRGIKARGLVPVSGSINSRDAEVVYFGTLDDVLMYMVDREYPEVLRFPWPVDAKHGQGGEWSVDRIIPPREIEIYDGRALDTVRLAYHKDLEERFSILDLRSKKIVSALSSPRARWTPILVAKI